MVLINQNYTGIKFKGIAGVAQLVEQLIRNQQVSSSNLLTSSEYNEEFKKTTGLYVY